MTIIFSLSFLICIITPTNKQQSNYRVFLKNKSLLHYLPLTTLVFCCFVLLLKQILTLQLRLTLNSQPFFYLSIPNAGITCVNHRFFFSVISYSQEFRCQIPMCARRLIMALKYDIMLLKLLHTRLVHQKKNKFVPKEKTYK